MKGSFTVQAGALASAVKYAARWLTARPTVPAHGGLLFEIPAVGDRLSIFGFNENATGRATLDVDSDDAAGAFVVSGRLLDSLVGTFRNGPVVFEQHDSLITVTAGNWRGTLPAMSEKDYPALPGQATLAGFVDGGELADAVHRAGSAASRDLTKSIHLTGVHVNFDEGLDDIATESGDPAYTLTLLATDRYHGARQTIVWEPDADGAPLGDSALVPGSVLVDAAEAFAGHRVAIGWQSTGESGVFSLSTLDRSLTVTTLGQAGYPREALMPIFDSQPPTAMTVTVKDLALPLKRAALLRGKETDHVLLHFSEGLLRLAVDGEMNGSDEEIAVEYDGPETSLLMKSETMQAALHTVPGDTAVIAFFPDAVPPRPLVITAPDFPNWRHILVPLRKTN